MNCFKIAYKLLKNNFKLYELYLTVLVVNVAIYYNFVAMSYNETYIQLTQHLQSASIISITCGFILICTVIFFMWHSNAFFLKQRQKETGLYMLMGISSSKVGMVFAIESIMLGALSLVLGLPIGISFSKLFFMLLGKASFLDAELPFTVSIHAIVHLIIVFVIIFIVLGFRNYNVVKKSQLINMINAAKKNSTVPKLNYTKGILGILLIIGGYIIGINIRQKEIDLLIASTSTLIMVCLGTYLLFGSFLTIVLSKLIKNKNIVYKNVRVICLNNIFFRLKLSYRTLAMTAILVASAVSAFSISLSFKQFAYNNAKMEAPYSFSYISSDGKTKDEVEAIIKKSKHKLLDSNEIKFFLSPIQYENKRKKVDNSNEAIITSYSQIEKTLEHLNYKNSILKQIKPNKNEITFILNANTIASPIFVKGETVKLEGRNYVIKDDIKLPFTGNVPNYGKKNVYVLPDSEYEKIKTSKEEITLETIQITNQENSGELINKISEVVPGGLEKVYPHVTRYVNEYYDLGILFFLGMFLSIVFIISTFSTLFFKILSNALMDREQFMMLKKIGMSKKEVEKAIYMQIGIELLIPVTVGIIHSIFAMLMLQQILNASFIFQTLIGEGLVILINIIFYIKMSKNYVKMVYI
jgi:putative ABC transport system permease protein